MHDEPDFEVFKTPDVSPGVAPQRRVGVIAAGVAAIAVAAVTAYFVFGRRQAPAPAATAQQRAEPQPPQAAPGGDATPIDLPPLDETDPFVRNLVKQISSHPMLAAWLATDGLIRNFTVVLVNVAEGKSPAGQLTMLRPSSRLRVLERAGDLYIDPRSYQRYDALAAAAASLDSAGAARIYTTLKPRIEEAHRELGFPDTPVDRTLERALVVLLGTPVLDSPPAIEPRGVGYGYADPWLERLPAAQKQLLRMGGQNVRTIQSTLREIAQALGITVDRLPAAR